MLGLLGPHFIFIVTDNEPELAIPMTILVFAVGGTVGNSIGFRLSLCAMESRILGLGGNQ